MSYTNPNLSYPKRRSTLQLVIPVARTDSATTKAWLPKDAVVTGVHVLQNVSASTAAGSFTVGLGSDADGILEAFSMATANVGLVNAGVSSGVFATRPTMDGQNGITSDYYAYYEAIKTFSNPESVNINVFTTPGIDTVDNNGLIEESIDMIENERCDSLYIVTTPDTSANGTEIIGPEDISDTLYGEYDSNYTATYWPWLQMNDTENNVYIWLPPTGEVVRNIALTDNIAFPWFATAGLNRGVTNAIKSRLKLKLSDRDTLYENRINPMATFSEEGVVIWGNKTLQIKDSALNRINVRRLLLQARKLISAVSVRLLFEQNDQIVRSQFLSLVNPILENIRKERGLTDFRVQLNDTTESIDRNELNGRIFLKPTRSLEFIFIEFVVTPTGASCENV